MADIVLTDAMLGTPDKAEWIRWRDADGCKMLYSIGVYDEFTTTVRVGFVWLKYSRDICFTIMDEHCGKGYALAAIEQLLRLHPELAP